MNNVALVYSNVAKLMNRRATGYAYLLTTAARDGGMREDSIKIFPMFVHPRSSQVYDRKVLAKDWDCELKECLEEEKRHFGKLMKLDKMIASVEDVEVKNRAMEEREKLLDEAPGLLHQVWDNLNYHTGHRVHRVEDDCKTSNLDGMASLLIKDRIGANHMRNQGVLKDVEDLCIEDLIVNDKEKDYVFLDLVHYYSDRLVKRHPKLFNSILRLVKDYRPHQFQKEMEGKSEMFTGRLYDKSESVMDELLVMMEDSQDYISAFVEDNNGDVVCYERKTVSGDQLTEKNMSNGIKR